MKKLISGIMAIAILASAVLCGTTTAFAADTGNSAVGDVEMWNHDFKNKLTGELMWAIDDIADTDTVAVKINLTSYCEDIYTFADKNDRLDEIIVNEDGGKTYSDELLRDYEEYKKKTDAMTDAVKTLVSKYEDANKEYQTKLLNAIKIPLMVYSGRIIQNYPLGLGIRAIIKTNQLVFEAVSKSGSDVYNILSTGQLNGLSIAFLLSIKNVYGDANGLDILLIDDPLQTIDDISAISLADLLTQQGIGQIVLSTHEEAKAALLRYKFKRAGMSVLEQNMQALYMKTVTEE